MQSIMSRDITTGFKNAGHGDFVKPSRDFMATDHSGLARYRSAPSTFLGALLDLEPPGDNNSSSGDESEAFFSAMMDPRDLNHHKSNSYSNQMQQQQQQYSSMKEEVQDGCSGGAVVGSYSLGMETSVSVHGNNTHRNSSNLARQSSSPAGFLNGFGVMGDVGSYRVHNHAAEATSSHMNFSSASSSATRFMPSIPENATGNGNTAAARGYPHDSWKELPFKSLKRNRDEEPNMFSNFNDLENQNQEPRKNGLVPKNTGKMPVVEKYLHFQPETTTPCQMRAKRGFATHPRSIAERMRRTRISEKMKKLQDLFPNMDKQTNTADMLDLAVEYIKDLQKQVQTLTDTKARCVCSNKSQ